MPSGGSLHVRCGLTRNGGSVLPADEVDENNPADGVDGDGSGPIFARLPCGRVKTSSRRKGCRDGRSKHSPDQEELCADASRPGKSYSRGPRLLLTSEA